MHKLPARTGVDKAMTVAPPDRTALDRRLYCLGSLEFEPINHNRGYTQCDECKIWLKDIETRLVREHERKFWPGEPVRFQPESWRYFGSPDDFLKGEIVRQNSPLEY